MDPSHGSLTPNRDEPAKRIFLAALSLPLVEREALLDRACVGDAALRARVDALLKAFDQAGGFLDAPTVRESLLAPDFAGIPSGDASTARAAGDSMLLPITERPGAIIGRYKLLQQIGEGGFGVVFMAEQREPVQRKVALKIIKLGMDTRQVIARFEAERQALALMDHPNVARVFDGGATESGRPYFVMEYVRGDPITDFADAHKLGVRERLDLFMQVCAAVQHAHQKGVIHRDIKPRNVLVSMVDGRPHAKVIDFGIAKATGARLTDKTLFTEHRQLIGTPEYMSPEQAEGSPDIDTRTDVYALGVLLYELLTGVTPFDARRLRSAAFAEMQRIIREEEPPAPSLRILKPPLTPVPRSSTSPSVVRNSTSPSVASALFAHEQDRVEQPPPADSASATPTSHLAAARQCDPAKLGTLIKGELDWIVMKALDKDRARRYESPNQFAADVQRHLSGEPVLAAPPSLGYRIRKFVRKHRAGVLTASLVAATLLLGVTATSLAMLQARAERDRARIAHAEAEMQRSRAERTAYAANISTALMALERVDTNELNQCLEQCPEYLRGFEWRLLKARSDQADIILRGHTALAWIIKFSPDGTRVATGSHDHTVRLWDSRSGACLAILRGVDSEVHALAFSDDGTLVAAGGKNGLACVWNCATGDLVAPLRGHAQGPVGSIAFAPAARRVITTSGDATTRVWDANTGESIWILHHSTPAKRAIFSPDGSLVLTTCGDEAKLWDASSGEPWAALEGVTSLLEKPAFRPDGAFIIGALGTGVSAWNTATGCRSEDYESQHNHFGTFLADRRVLQANPGNCFLETETGGMAWIRFGWEDTLHPLAVNTSPLLLATGSWDDSARIWDGESDHGPIKTLVGHAGRVIGIQFSPEGDRVGTCAWDSEPRIWSILPDSHVDPELPTDGDARRLYPPTQSDDGSLLATRFEGGPVCVWDSLSGAAKTILYGHTADTTCAEFSRDKRQLVTASKDRTLRVWDVASGRQVHLLSGHAAEVSLAHYSPTGASVLSVCDDFTARVWALREGGGVDLRGHEGGIIHGAFSADERFVATASEDRTARIWDARTGQQLRVLGGHADRVCVVCFSPDGKTVTTGAGDGTVRAWNARNGQLLHTWSGLAGSVAVIKFFSHSRTFLAASSGERAGIWNCETGSEIASLEGHRDQISCVDISPDESRIVTGSYDGMIRFWDSSSGECLLTMRADRYRVNRVVFSPDGTRVYTYGTAQGSRVWDSIPRRERMLSEGR